MSIIFDDKLTHRIDKDTLYIYFIKLSTSLLIVMHDAVISDEDEGHQNRL